MKKKLEIEVKNLDSSKSLGKGEWFDSIQVEPEESVLAEKGRVYGLVSLTGRWNLKGEYLLNNFLTDFQSAYFKETQESSVLKSLEQAVKEAHQKLVAALVSEEQSPPVFTMILVVIWGNVIYLAEMGESKVALIRDNEIEYFNQSKKIKKSDVFSAEVSLISGLVKGKDLLLLGLPAFWENVDMPKLKPWFKTHSLDEIIEKIVKSFEVLNLTLWQAMILSFEVSLYPTEEEVINLKVPETEKDENQVKPWEKVLSSFQNIISTFKTRLPSSPIRVPKLASLKRETNFSPDQPSKEEKRFPNLGNTLKRQSTFSRSREVKTIFSSLKTREHFSRIVLQIKKKWFLLVEHFKQARGVKDSSVVKKEDPSRYLQGNWFLRLVEKKGVILIVFLVVLLVGSVYLTSYLQNKNQVQDEHLTTYNDTLSKIEEAKRVSFATQDRIKVYSEALIVSKELKEQNYADEKVKVLDQKIVELKGVIYNIVTISDPKILADLKLKRDQANGEDLISTNTSYYISDRENRIIYEIVKSNNEVKEISLGESAAPTLGVESKGSSYFLTEQGIGELDASLGKLDIVVEKEAKWQSVVDMASYYGNLYLLDRLSHQLWKFLPAGNGFSQAVAYFDEGTWSDEVNSVAIDGSIYLLFQNGKIDKYTSGVKQEFTVSGLDQPFSTDSKLFTQEDYQNLYVMDKGVKRVVVINKKGEYQKQFTNDDWQSLQALLVDKEEKNILLLVDNQLITFPR